MKLSLPLKTISFFMILALLACSGSKSMYKKGKKLDEAGLSYEAAHFYIQALQRNQRNDDAIIALKTTGQKVLDEMYAKFYQFYADRKDKDAVYAYLEAKNFKELVENLNVKLSEADYYEEYYNQVKENYIKELYLAAQTELDNENFAGAEVYLHEIQQLEPSYKDVDQLKRFAFVEPRYRKALDAYDNDKYRTAYFLFEEILEQAGDYKESRALKDISQENAQYTIGFVQFENKSGIDGVEATLSGIIMRDLMNSNDPFLRILDRSMTERIINEQKLGMTGIIDEKTAAKAGELLGAKAILVGTVSSAVKKEGKLHSMRKKGYLGKPVTKVNAETGKKYTDMTYTKVYYTDYTKKNEVSCTFQYRLISAETGEILLSDVVTQHMEDEVAYSTFHGDSKYLYKGTWAHQKKVDKEGDKIYNSYSSKREIDRQLKADREVESAEILATRIYRKLAQQVAQKIKNFNPEA